MNRCQTCRYYKPVIVSAACTAGRCELAQSHDAEAVYPHTLAVALDSDGYRAGLRVSPEFGCVQWAACEGGHDD